MLNKSIIISVISSLFLVMTIQASEEIQMYSEAGYPYKNLIHKSQSVKIFFTEKEQNISCRVNVSLPSQSTTSNTIEVSKKQFEATPLASCLPRDQAKKLLAFAYL